MQKFAKLFFLVMPILCMDCKMNAEEHQSPAYVLYANSLMKSFAKEMKKEFGLALLHNSLQAA